MAKKQELVSDIPEFETDLEFDFENEIDGELNQEALKPKKSRGVIGNVLVGAARGMKDEAKNPNFVKETLRRSLPDSYGEITDAAEEVASGLYELYDESVKEVKPRIGRIGAKLNQLVPEESKRLKEITEKLAKWGGEDVGPQTAGAENQEENVVSSVLAGVFEQQQVQQKLDDAKTLVQGRIETKRFNSSYELQAAMSKNLAIQTQYTINTNERFQRKSLELQLRLFLSQKEYASKSTASNRIFQTQLEAIVKNTSLPEYAKITESERFKEVGKRRFIEGLYGEGSMLRQGMDKLKGTVRQAVSGFSTALDQSSMQLGSAIDAQDMLKGMNEMLLDMGEEPLSKAEMAGATLGANITTWFRDVMAKRIKSLNDDDDVVQERFAKYANMVNNPSGALQKMRESEGWQDKINDFSSTKGKLYQGLDFVLSHFEKEAPSRTLGKETDLLDLDAPSMGFDAKAHLSLTDIIPGHLANIHREIVMLRTGREDVDKQVYDFGKKEFVGQTEMGNRVEKTLGDHIKSTGYNYVVENAVKLFSDGENLDDSQILALKRFFSRLSRENDNPLDPDSILASKHFSDLPDELQDLVESRLKSSEAGSSKYRDRNRLTKAIEDIRKKTPSSDKLLAGFEKAGYTDLLEKKGLGKKTDDGRLNIDEEAYAKLLEDNAFIRSDINVKEAIRELNPAQLLNEVKNRMKGKSDPTGTDYANLAKKYFGKKEEPKQDSFSNMLSRFNPKEAYEGIKKTKLFNWKYQPGKGDDEQHSGPMAQDVKKNLGEDVAPKGKMIDLQSMNGAVMAAVKHLGDKVDGLFKSGGDKSTVAKSKTAEDLTNEILGKIKADTQRITEFLDQQQKMVEKMTASGGLGGSVMTGGQLAHDGTYRGMILSSMRSVMDLGMKAGSDTLSSLKSFFAPGEKKEGGKSFIGDAKNFIKDQLTDKNSGSRKAFGQLYEKAASLSSTVFDQASRFLNEGIPNGIKFIKDRATKAVTWIGDKLNDAKDLYLPDGVEPVIRAVKMKAGFYRDSVTGEILDTMDKLSKAKGDIVDAAGNVIVSLDERAKGLRDRYGDMVRSNVAKIVELGVGAATWLKDRAKQTLDVLSDKTISAKDKLGEWWKRSGGISSGGGNKYAKDTFLAVLDIRDILLDQKEEVLKRIKKRASSRPSGSSRPADPDEVSGPPKKFSEVMKDAVDESFVKRTELRDKAKSLRSKLKGIFAGASASGGTSEEVQSEGGSSAAGRSSVSGSGGTSILGKGKELLSKAGGIGGIFEKSKDFVNKNEKLSSIKDKITSAKDRVFSILKPKSATPPERIEPTIVGKPKLTVPATPASTGGSKLSKVKGMLTTKGKGLMDLGASALGGAASLAGGLLGGKSGGQETQPSGPPQPEEVKAATPAKRVKKKLDQKQRAWNDTDGDGVRDGSIEDRDQKLAALRESRKKDEAKADLSFRYKGGGLDLMGMLSKGLEFATSGFGKLFGVIGSGIAGIIKLSGKLIPSLAGAAVKGTAGVAKLAGKGVLGTVKAAGKCAIGLGRFALTRALPAVAMAGLNIAGSAIGAVASVLSSPVVLAGAALAATGYGLYKLYQYAVRDKANDYERIRLRQYGFGYNSDVDQYNHYPYMLEAYLEDGRVGYDNGRAYILDKKVRPEELLELFKIDKEDAEQAHKFAEWYSKRFKPFFLTHMTALTSVSPRGKLKDIAGLKPDEKIKYLETVGFDSGPYDIETSPVKSLEVLSTDKKFVKESIEALIARAKVEKPKDNKPSVPPSKPGESKDAAAARSLYGVQTNTPVKTVGGADLAQAARVQEAQRRNAELNRKIAPNMGSSDDAGQAPKSNGDATSTGSRFAGIGKVPMAPGGPMDGGGGRQFVKFNDKTINIDSLNPVMLKLFLGMAEEYGKQTGKSILVTSGVRDSAQQAELYRKDPTKAAKPGSSLHEFGLALDIDSKIANELDQLGLMKKYGFTRPVGGEPWHVEPAGIQRNPSLAKENEQQRDAMISAGVMRGGAGYGSVPNSEKGRRNKEMAFALLDVPPSPNTAPPKETLSEKVLQTPKTAGAIKPIQSTDPDMVKKVTAIKEANDQNAKQGIPSSSNAKVSIAQQTAQKNSATNDLPPPDAEVRPSSKGGEEKATNEGAGGDLKEIIAKNARRAGEDPTLMQAFAAVESDMNPQAKSGNSSASGLFQFIRSTWDSLLSKFGSKYGLDQSKTPFDIQASTLLASEYVKENKKVLSPVKSNPGLTDLYLAHFLGPNGAKAFLSMPPDAIAAYRFPGPASSNPDIFYTKDRQPRTVKQVYDELSSKLSAKSSRYGVKPPEGSFTATTFKSSAIGSSVLSNGSVGGKPSTAKDQSGSVAAQASAPTAGPNAGQKRVEEPRRQNSGIFLDSRPQLANVSSRPESGDSMASGFGSITSTLDKSVGIQQESLNVLREILKNVNVKTVTEAMAGIVTASATVAKTKEAEPSPKEEDRRNLGRKDLTGSSALNMRRTA